MLIFLIFFQTLSGNSRSSMMHQEITFLELLKYIWIGFKKVESYTYCMQIFVKIWPLFLTLYANLRIWRLHWHTSTCFYTTPLTVPCVCTIWMTPYLVCFKLFCFFLLVFETYHNESAIRDFVCRLLYLSGFENNNDVVNPNASYQEEWDENIWS